MAKKRTAKAPAKPATATGNVFRLKIALAWIVPEIWRRVEVPDCTLEGLHEVIQRAMPWSSSHLWCFETGSARYIDREFMDFEEDRPADETQLGDLHSARIKKFKYEYDFGDGWVHNVTIEKVVPWEAGAKYPRCTAGERACPPDDCGGPPGYERLLDILAHPRHKEHKDMLEWAGGPIDPEAFDRDAVNKNLAKLKL